MNIHNWLKIAQGKILRLDAELILAHVLKVDRPYLHAHPNQDLTKTELKTANRLLARRQNHEPLAYLIGQKEFYGRNFIVTPDVLIPRPATEDLIDLAKTLKPQTILDLGTGSGCIAITLALELPNTKVTATDISPQALKIAQTNAQILAPNYSKFLLSDLYKSPEIRHQKFHLICANLPYVDPTWAWNSPDLTHEPKSALYAQENGLKLIKKFLDQTPDHLHPDAHLLLEADPTQHPEIINYAQVLNLKHTQTQNLILHFTNNQ